MADDEEVVEGAGESDVQEEVAADEGGDDGAAPAYGPAAKPKPDIFSLLLILTFTAFLAGTALAANELHDFYKVNFWVMK